MMYSQPVETLIREIFWNTDGFSFLISEYSYQKKVTLKELEGIWAVKNKVDNNWKVLKVEQVPL